MLEQRETGSADAASKRSWSMGLHACTFRLSHTFSMQNDWMHQRDWTQFNDKTCGCACCTHSTSSINAPMHSPQRTSETINGGLISVQKLKAVDGLRILHATEVQGWRTDRIRHIASVSNVLSKAQKIIAVVFVKLSLSLATSSRSSDHHDGNFVGSSCSCYNPKLHPKRNVGPVIKL